MKEATKDRLWSIAPEGGVIIGTMIEEMEDKKIRNDPAVRVACHACRAAPRSMCVPNRSGRSAFTAPPWPGSAPPWIAPPSASPRQDSPYRSGVWRQFPPPSTRRRKMARICAATPSGQRPTATRSGGPQRRFLVAKSRASMSRAWWRRPAKVRTTRRASMTRRGGPEIH